MATLRQWFRDCEEIKVVVFHGNPSDYGLDAWVKLPRGEKLTLADLGRLGWLELHFSSGFGSQGVPDFTAWSQNFVYCVHEYDGSTYLRTLDRNPP